VALSPKLEVLDVSRRPSLDRAEAAEELVTQKKGAPRKTERPDNPDLPDVAFQGLRDLVLRHGTDDLLNDLTVLENEQRWNTANIEPAR
jgi:hypothetical protein